jgi:hypothetical protein
MGDTFPGEIETRFPAIYVGNPYNRVLLQKLTIQMRWITRHNATNRQPQFDGATKVKPRSTSSVGPVLRMGTGLPSTGFW